MTSAPTVGSVWWNLGSFLQRQCGGSGQGSSPCSAPTRCGGWQSTEDALMALCISVPMVAGAGRLPRAVLPPGPALVHTKIPCISIIITLHSQWTCEGGMSSFPPCRELGVAGRNSVPGATARTCHELLHPLGTVGLIFWQSAQYKGYKANGCRGVIAAWSLGENTL